MVNLFHSDVCQLNTNINNREDYFVAAALVSVQLAGVMETAKSMSLAAKNANVIATRAGEQAVGFQAITDFIDELANNTMFLVKTINEIALEASITAVEKLHAQDALSRMKQARQNTLDARYISSLDPIIDRQTVNTKQHNEHFNDNIRALAVAIEDIRLQMRSAGVITSSCRVEAAQLGGYRLSLEAVADKVETASETIKTTLNRCHRILTDARKVAEQPAPTSTLYPIPGDSQR